MAIKIAHAAQRKAFELVRDTVGKKAIANRKEGYVGVINAIQKLLGDAWPDEAYDRLRAAFGSDGKWTQFFNNLLDHVDVEFLKGLFMSIGFEGGFTGFRETRKMAKRLMREFLMSF